MELQMTAHELKTLALNEITTTTEKDEEYSIPLDISDIINICREYNKLGWQIQQQVENILEVGVEESIRSGNVKRESLPYIRSFLKAIISNAYFGDAVIQAQDCIVLIKEYEYKYQEVFAFTIN
jgi:hypothetical protein